MAKFKNVSPLGALDLPLVGRIVEPGEEFEVPDDLAVHLEGQDESFRRIDTTSRAVKPSTAGKTTTTAAAGNPESEGSNDNAA